MAEATDFHERIIDAAGYAMSELKKGCNPHEAQIAIAFMCVYMCSQYEINIDTFCDVMRSNMKQSGADPILINRVIERMHNHLKEQKIQVAGTLN